MNQKDKIRPTNCCFHEAENAFVSFIMISGNVYQNEYGNVSLRSMELLILHLDSPFIFRVRGAETNYITNLDICIVE